MAKEKPCTHPDHVSVGDHVRLLNTHAMAGHGLFVVKAVDGEGVVVADAGGREHHVKYGHIECVMEKD